MVEKASRAATTDHWELVSAWHLRHALPLTEAPQLTAWQDTLKTYPEKLQIKLIENATQFLAEPHGYPLSLINAHKLAAREVPMALAGELAWSVERALRILFAVNRQWEPDCKWLRYEAARLRHKPERLVERVNSVFTLPDLRERVMVCLQLLLDVLELVPEHIDVAREKRHVTEAMQPEELG